jgi:hypothetical protein
MWMWFTSLESWLPGGERFALVAVGVVALVVFQLLVRKQRN